MSSVVLQNLTEMDVVSVSGSSNCTLPLILKKRKPFRSQNPRQHQCQDPRVMSKRGRINVHLHKIPDKLSYMRDLYTTLVNLRWRWIMFTVVLVNAFAYLLFSGFFLFDAWASGDFDDLPDHNMCIVGTNHFTSYFMLGMETITTTGYGYFYPTEYCRFGWVVLTASTLAVIFIDGAFISVVYVKISRPTQRTWDCVFSKKAVISLRNGQLCLIFRVNDYTFKHWVNSKINVFLVKEFCTPEGEINPNHVVELKIQPYGTLIWPVDIIHEIDHESPLWDVSAKDLMYNTKFEVLAVLTGSSVLTGNSSTSQTSYLSREILWGFRFSPCIDYSLIRRQYVVHRKNFNKTFMHDTPLCSAQRLCEVQREVVKKRLSLEYVVTSSDHDGSGQG